MTGQDPTQMLFAFAVGAVVMMVLAVIKGLGGLIIVPAGFFAAVIVWVSLRVNRGDGPGNGHVIGEGADDNLRIARGLSRNSRIVGVAYGFSAIAMQALYLTPLTGLRWQHGWQYASVFALLAVTAFEYGRIVVAASGEIRERLVGFAVPLMIAQSVFSAGGLAFLALSGKVFARRADWAANVVFLFAALMIMVLGAIALRTYAAMTEE